MGATYHPRTTAAARARAPSCTGELMKRLALALALSLAALACGDGKEQAASAPSAPAATPPAAPAAATALVVPSTTPAPDSLPKGLLLALAQFEVGPDGKVLPKPGPAKAEILVRQGGAVEGDRRDRGSRLQRVPQGDGVRRARRPRDPHARRHEGGAQAVAQGREGRLRAGRDAVEQGLRRQVQPHARRRDRRRATATAATDSPSRRTTRASSRPSFPTRREAATR